MLRKCICLLSVIFWLQCSVVNKLQLQIPPELQKSAVVFSITQPLMSPENPGHLLKKEKTYMVEVQPNGQGKAIPFQVQWVEDTRQEAIPAFLEDIQVGESRDFHGLVVHQLIVQTATPEHSYSLAFGISKSGTYYQHTEKVQTETAVASIIPSEIKILEDGTPVGKITIREPGISSFHADVTIHKHQWNATYSFMFGQVRFLVESREGPIAYFILKPGKKLISRSLQGKIYLAQKASRKTSRDAVLAYLFLNVIFQARENSL